jgi:hypothetical protein
VHHQRWIVIEVVRQLVPETIADLLPQLYESLPSFDVDVCFLGQKVCHHPHVDFWLLLPNLSDGLGSELIEVGFQGLKELSAQTVSPDGASRER